MTCFHPIKAWKNTALPIYGNDPCNQEFTKASNCISFIPKPGWQEIKIPCGECLGCRLDHANEWATRCWCEAQQWKNNCFVTLTYNSGKRKIRGQKKLDSLPKTPNGRMTLKYDDIKRFLKRLRKNEQGLEYWINPITKKYENPIRFFGCGEYGPKNGRPHYHFILFNWKPDDLKYFKKTRNGDLLYKSKKLQKIWGCGFVVIGMANYESACYTSRYVQKKAGIHEKVFNTEFDHWEILKYYANKEFIKEDTGEIITIKDELTLAKRRYKKKKIKEENEPEPEFVQMSRMPGLGRKWFENNKKHIYNNHGILIKTRNGIKNRQVPKYFKNLMEIENWKKYHQWHFEVVKIGIENFNQKLNQLNIIGKTQEEKEIIYLKMIEDDMSEKAKILRRDNIDLIDE